MVRVGGDGLGEKSLVQDDRSLCGLFVLVFGVGPEMSWMSVVSGVESCC